MAKQPRGTVTLLFSDVEGSTRLLQQLGRESYAEALEFHGSLLRQAFERDGGYEVDSEGDAFFVAFQRGEDAVSAAADAQRKLAVADWPQGSELRVRMGIHTGEPLALPPKYVGLDVHRAARIMVAGHGGQVLLSEATRKLLRPTTAMIDLGEHRLKDLLQPEHLYQLEIAGLTSEFPALKTLGNRPTNLPVQPNSLVGREVELGEVATLVRGEDVRLVTLTGPGGTGKTRLALQTAAELLEDFPSGVFFVSLAPVTDPAQVVPAIAQTLALREIGGEQLLDTVASYLQDRQMLLVLDNFEQVIDAAADVSALLQRCGTLKVLTTSRERLRVASERVHAVPPLRLPEPGADLAALATNEAVALFVARAQAADGRFTLTAENADAVSEICARLDGLPLAIELAAARTPALPPRTLLKRLDRRLPLLTGGRRDAEERQRTLRRTIEWSYDLLANEERDLFASLGVFVDGWRLDAAQEVCTRTGDAVELLDWLDSLVEKNLVRRRTDPDDEPRFWMLETIREYARERLEANGGGAEFESKHARHFLRVINAAQADYDAPDAAVRLAKLAADYRNLEAALSWAVAQRETNLVLRGVYGLCRFWVRRGYTSDAARWLAGALALEPSDAAVRLRSRVEYEAAWIATYQNEFERAAGLLETCVAANRLRGPSRELVDALADQGWLACVFGDLSRGLALCEESVELGHQLDDQTLADALNNLSLVKVECGAWDEARSLQEEAMALARKLARPSAVIRSRINLAWLALVQEDHTHARALAKQVLTEADALGDSPSTGDALFILGACTLVDDDLADAEHCLAESLRLYREQHTRTSALALEGVAALAGASGRHRRAARLLSAAQALRGPHVLPSERLIRDRMLASTLPDATEPVAEDDEPPMSLAHAVAFALGSTADQGGMTTTTV